MSDSIADSSDNVVFGKILRNADLIVEGGLGVFFADCEDNTSVDIEPA